MDSKFKGSKKILIVEDSSNSGESLKEVKEKLKNTFYEDRVIILAIYVTKKSKQFPDIYFDICEQPRMFEWNYIHHNRVTNSCFDINGVLCENTAKEQNDDGKNYKGFIRNAPLRVLYYI